MDRRRILIDRVAKTTHTDKAKVDSILTATLIEAINLIDKGELFKVRRLGTFFKKRKPPVKRKTPDGDVIDVPGKMKIVFRPSKWLTEYINRNEGD